MDAVDQPMPPSDSLQPTIPGTEQTAVSLTPEQRGKYEGIVGVSAGWRHAQLATRSIATTTGFDPGVKFILEAFDRQVEKVKQGDTGPLSRLLVDQALTLDIAFTEMMERAAQNRAEYPHAHERYMRLALKAQAQSRATLEALAKLHQPREQVVRHVHVYEGGQAVVAEQVHHHAAAEGHHGNISRQPHALGAALPGPDPFRHGMPVAGSPREEALPDARGRRRKRRAKR